MIRSSTFPLPKTFSSPLNFEEHWRGNNSEVTKPKLEVKKLTKSYRFIDSVIAELHHVFGHNRATLRVRS